MPAEVAPGGLTAHPFGDAATQDAPRRGCLSTAHDELGAAGYPLRNLRSTSRLVNRARSAFRQAPHRIHRLAVVADLEMQQRLLRRPQAHLRKRFALGHLLSFLDQHAPIMAIG